MIRPLTSWDYRVTKRLFQQVFDESEDPYFGAAWSQRTTALGYMSHGVLLGAAVLTKHRLEYIFIHEDYRDRGIGTQLLQAALLIQPNLHLMAVTDPGVRAWYVKHGFHPTSEDTYTRHTHHLRPLSKRHHPLSNMVVTS